MKRVAGKTARMAAVVLAMLYALFALDTAVLSIGFLVHLVPTAIVLAGAVLAWNRARSGAIWFGVAALASVVAFRTWAAPERFVLLTLPLAVIAVLFLLAMERSAGT
ncbi:MAG: hypothetical protein PVH00_06735 [Gemmatimonadota bacterium]